MAETQKYDMGGENDASHGKGWRDDLIHFWHHPLMERVLLSFLFCDIACVVLEMFAAGKNLPLPGDPGSGRYCDLCALISGELLQEVEVHLMFLITFSCVGLQSVEVMRLIPMQLRIPLPQLTA